MLPGAPSNAFSARRTAFSARRTALSARRTAFSARRTAFSARRTAFSARRTAFSARRTAFIPFNGNPLRRRRDRLKIILNPNSKRPWRTRRRRSNRQRRTRTAVPRVAHKKRGLSTRWLRPRRPLSEASHAPACARRADSFARSRPCVCAVIPCSSDPSVNGVSRCTGPLYAPRRHVSEPTPSGLSHRTRRSGHTDAWRRASGSRTSRVRRKKSPTRTT